MPNALPPSAIIAHAAEHDGTSVTVTGPVSAFQQRGTPRGTVSVFKVCDTDCVVVVDRGGAAHANGDTVTLTGTFHTSFKTRQGAVKNAVEVGG